MSMTADQIVDRRRLRRKLTFWRVIGFLAVLVIVVGAIFAFGGNNAFPRALTPQIARITVNGFIGTSHRMVTLLDDLANTDAVKGVIVAIDSTGGSTAGGEELYENLRKLAAKKPTVAAIATVGASAAYMAALATDHIISRRTSLTGSIGVLFEYPEVSQLMDKVGVRVEEVKSSPLKAEPQPFRPLSDEARAMLQAVIGDTYDWFVGILTERRNLARTEALALADGRIFSGQQAVAAKLIDEIGGEDAAVAWLGTKGVDTKLPVRDWEPERAGGFGFPFSDLAAVWIGRALGLSPELGTSGMLERILPENLKLDGLQSVWHAPR